MMIEIPNLKEIRIPSISDVYTNPIFQFLLFCIVLVSAFMSGIIYHLGLYLIPLIDRDSVISTILLYMVFIVGVAAIARGIVVPYVLFLYQFKSHIVNGSLVFIFVKILGAFVPAIMLVVIAFRTLKNTILAIPNYLYLDVIIMFSLLVGAIIILYFWYKSSNKIFFLLSLVYALLFSFASGALYVDIQRENEPDFEIATKTAPEKSIGNILFRSADGILFFNKENETPIFLPWIEIKFIIPSSKRAEAIRKKMVGQSSVTLTESKRIWPFGWVMMRGDPSFRVLAS